MQIFSNNKGSILLLSSTTDGCKIKSDKNSVFNKILDDLVLNSPTSTWDHFLLYDLTILATFQFLKFTMFFLTLDYVMLCPFVYTYFLPHPFHLTHLHPIKNTLCSRSFP